MLRKRHEPRNKTMQPGMASGTFTQVLVCHDVHWVLMHVGVCEIPLVKMKKTSFYHMLIDHRIT